MRQTAKNILIRTILGFLIILLVTGCVKEEFSYSELDTSVDIQPALATPLGYFDFRLEEDLRTTENSLITINNDRIISLNYFGEISSDPAGEIFHFDTISEHFTLPNPTAGIINLYNSSYQKKFNTTVPIFLSATGGSAEIYSILIGSGSLEISGVTFPEAKGEVVIEIPGLKTDGKSFQVKLLPDMDDINVDLSGYSLQLTNDKERNNLIQVGINVYYPQQEQFLFATKPVLDFDFDILIPEWEKIYGFLGREHFDFGKLSFNTDLHSVFPGGSFRSYDPRLNLKTINSFSFPVGMGLSQIVAYSADSGMISLDGPGIPVPPDYFIPAYPEADNMRKVAQDSLVIHSGNSNISKITTSSPERITYVAEFLTNPGTEKIQNIVYSDSKFTTRVELQLPFHGSAKSLPIRDTMQMDLSGLKFPVDDIIKEVLFKLYYENSFPAEISLQLYLADENYMVTDTLFETFTDIKAAEPTEVLVNDPPYVSGEMQAYVPGDELENIRKSRYIIGEALLSTNESHKIVKIFDNQNLFINIGIVFDINTTIEDF